MYSECSDIKLSGGALVLAYWRHPWLAAAVLAASVAFPMPAAQALPPACQKESIACIANGKVGEKFCVNGRWSPCQVSGGTTPPAGPDPRCADRTATGVIKCVVEQPDVRHHETDYKSIVFAPNDTVYIEADGCVQSGGRGDTWHRYVNPSGPNTVDPGGLYHGLVRIPTGKPTNGALVRILQVIGQPILVTGVGADVNSLYLHLGFEDDDYLDNGYNDHDDGPDGQCTFANGGFPANVAVTIYRDAKATPPVSRFDFDLASNGPPDANGLMYNPYWSWQLRPQNAGKMPDTSTCHNFSERGSTVGVPDLYLSPSFADCTDQADSNSVDLRQMCQISGQFSGGFGGHVNWFPVTVEGSAFWGDHSGVLQQIFGDDDYTFSFVSDAPGNPLSVNGRNGLHVEFDSDETIDHFTNSEWSAFHAAVDNDDKALAQKYFDGHTILTGMYGLDTDHMKAELHPLFAMATRRDANSFENGANDEAWMMFVRNVGDEGFCSHLLWSAQFEDYTFRLPWRPGMTSVQVDQSKTSFDGTDGTSGPSVRFVPPTVPRQSENEGVYVTFHLGPVSSFPFIDGTLHLIWSGPVSVLDAKKLVDGAHSSGVRLPEGGKVATGIVVASPPPEEDEEADDIERKLAVAAQRLQPALRDKVGAARLSLAFPRAATHRLASGGPALLAPARPILARPRFVLKPHAVSVGEATQKLARDAAMAHELCAATNNAPFGLPKELCTEAAQRK
jgi:hypothetical protein